jgi:glycosyltransferase involved in cell wall biosynthesis
MDFVDVPCQELGYEVVTLDLDAVGRPTPGDQSRLRSLIASSKLVYGYGLGAPQMARALRIPYILVLEYDWATQMTVTTSQVQSVVRKVVRGARCTWKYAKSDIPLMRSAHSIHCNGFPIFDETRHFNDQRLLYLDSRMPSDLVIDAEVLSTRLAKRPASEPIRMLFSGRYEPMKGALDAVMVGIECLRRGMNIEMHCFGQGSLIDQMRDLARNAPGWGGGIHIHDAVPYPELVQLSRTFDLFVCCHIQGDPSCTYLESFGAGLPIVGYGNRMWRRLSEVSRAGFWSPMRRPEKVADDIERLLSDPALLPAMSQRAREFALEHAYELEFNRRIAALNRVLAE